MYNAMVQEMARKMIDQGMPAAAAQAAAQRAIEQAGGVGMEVSMGAPGLYHTPQSNLGFYHESLFDLSSSLCDMIICLPPFITRVLPI